MSGINGFPGFLSNFVRGTTKDFKITIARNGEAVDITGAKFVLTIDTDIDPETDPVLEIVIDPPSDPVNGIAVGAITDTQTYALSAGSYYYSVRYVNAAGATYLVDMGRIRVYEAISKVIT